MISLSPSSPIRLLSAEGASLTLIRGISEVRSTPEAPTVGAPIFTVVPESTEGYDPGAE